MALIRETAAVMKKLIQFAVNQEAEDYLKSQYLKIRLYHALWRNIRNVTAFQNILDKLGVAFDFLEDLLNKIIEFLKGLFGPDDAESTTAGNPETTSPGSSSGSEETGDAGIALAATVCVAASAAFVLTRKKKETF